MVILFTFTTSSGRIYSEMQLKITFAAIIFMSAGNFPGKWCRKVGKILVVDNQFGVRRLLVETLLEDLHEIQMAENAEEALLLFLVFKPNLILMDMNIINGIEILEKIRVLDRLVPVIMMTDYGDTHNMEQAKELGILYYMDKPFDLFELRERVKKIFNSSGISTQG